MNELDLAVVTRGGDRFYVRADESDREVLTSRYQRLRFFAPDYVPRGDDTIVDAGAHIGAFTVAAARRAPQGRVHAIEPARENFAVLAKNVAANRLANVALHQVALSGRSGTITLHHTREQWGHSVLDQIEAGDQKSTETVAAETLPEFIARNGIERVDYMKMNVEGAEYAILLGTPERDLRVIRWMLIEYHPGTAFAAGDLVEHLQASNFTVDVTPSDAEDGKGWLVARCRT